MTQKIITITVGAGQARPRRRTRRRFRVNLWTVAKYAALTVAGILLFRAGAAYPFRAGYRRWARNIRPLPRAIYLPVANNCPRRDRRFEKTDFQADFKEDEEQ